MHNSMSRKLQKVARHAICHECMDIIREKYKFWGVHFRSEHTKFCQKKVFLFAAFYGILVTHSVAHRFTFGNPILAMPIIYLLSVI